MLRNRVARYASSQRSRPAPSSRSPGLRASTQPSIRPPLSTHEYGEAPPISSGFGANQQSSVFLPLGSECISRFESVPRYANIPFFQRLLARYRTPVGAAAPVFDESATTNGVVDEAGISEERFPEGLLPTSIEARPAQWHDDGDSGAHCWIIRAHQETKFTFAKFPYCSIRNLAVVLESDHDQRTAMASVLGPSGVILPDISSFLGAWMATPRHLQLLKYRGFGMERLDDLGVFTPEGKADFAMTSIHSSVRQYANGRDEPWFDPPFQKMSLIAELSYEAAARHGARFVHVHAGGITYNELDRHMTYAVQRCIRQKSATIRPWLIPRLTDGLPSSASLINAWPRPNHPLPDRVFTPIMTLPPDEPPLTGPEMLAQADKQIYYHPNM